MWFIYFQMRYSSSQVRLQFEDKFSRNKAFSEISQRTGGAWGDGDRFVRVDDIVIMSKRAIDPL